MRKNNLPPNTTNGDSLEGELNDVLGMLDSLETATPDERIEIIESSRGILRTILGTES